MSQCPHICWLYYISRDFKRQESTSHWLRTLAKLLQDSRRTSLGTSLNSWSPSASPSVQRPLQRKRPPEGWRSDTQPPSAGEMCWLVLVSGVSLGTSKICFIIFIIETEGIWCEAYSCHISGCHCLQEVL